MNNLQKLDKVSVINSFKYHKPDLHPKLDLGKAVNNEYDNNMKELVSLAKMLNGDRNTLLIHFWGDSKSGLKAIVEGENKDMIDRINGFFTEWFKKQDEF